MTDKIEYSAAERGQMRDAADVGSALATLRGMSSRLRGVPDTLMKSGIHVAVTAPEIRGAWEKRADNEEDWHDTLCAVAVLLERILDKMDSGAEADDAELADSDPSWRSRAGAMRRLGNIPVSVPGAVLIGALLDFLSGRPTDMAVLEAGEKPDALKAAKDARDTVLARAARRLTDALAEYKPPELTIGMILEDADIEADDLMDMPDRAFKKTIKLAEKMRQRWSA